MAIKLAWRRRKYGRHFEHELLVNGSHVASIFKGKGSDPWGKLYKMNATLYGKQYGASTRTLQEAKKIAESVVKRYYRGGK